MKTSEATNFQIILDSLKEFGLLLESDAKLPSISGLIAGEPVRGSWWGHARAQQIFTVLQQIADHKDVLIVKLVMGKVTFVHRKLWPDIVSIGQARELWQMQKLSPAVKMLLDQIDEHGSLLTNALEWPSKFKSIKPGEAVRELEKRLLIHSEEFHTASGAHAKQVETWEHWTKRVGFKNKPVAIDKAKRRLEKKIELLNELSGASAKLPWTNTR